jgi:pilus assembly protein CpaB
VLTRQIDKGQATTAVVLQNARVLAVDQSADERSNKPSVAKSVTLEVKTVEAQKVWLASTVGSLSLLLRKAGESAETRTRKITLKDLESGLFGGDAPATAKVVVTRASKKQEYTVPVEEENGSLAKAEKKQAGS